MKTLLVIVFLIGLTNGAVITPPDEESDLPNIEVKVIDSDNGLQSPATGHYADTEQQVADGLASQERFFSFGGHVKVLGVKAHTKMHVSFKKGIGGEVGVSAGRLGSTHGKVNLFGRKKKKQGGKGHPRKSNIKEKKKEKKRQRKQQRKHAEKAMHGHEDYEEDDDGDDEDDDEHGEHTDEEEEEEHEEHGRHAAHSAKHEDGEDEDDADGEKEHRGGHDEEEEEEEDERSQARRSIQDGRSVINQEN